ncbi:MAG: glycosyltransferase family 4 protein [Desulfuromusa sp.]|nr:glycosyltransferase family 4 protein [Desulfuromusa sp.]
MKILIVTQYFWPENFRINDLCVQLVKRGHTVTVLTGKPNYPTGVVFPEFKENPSAFNQYASCEVMRLPVMARGDGSSIKLIFNYISYVLSASLLGAWKLRKKSFDLIFVYEPSPVTVCLPAILIKKLRKIPVVFWVQDLWPETLESVGVVKSKRLLGLIGKMVSFIYNRCDLILGQSRAFYDGIARYCDDKEKIKYFPNWAEGIFKEKVTANIPEITAFKDDLKILFAGNIGDAQDFPAILSAAEIIKDKNIKAKFFIVGDGRMFDWIVKEVYRRKLGNYVYLLGRHPLEAMPEFYATADILLATLRESPVFSMTIPAKVQSYMTAGKPILTMLSGEGSRVVSEAECGLIADSGDYKGLARNITIMTCMTKASLMTLGYNARVYAGKEFDRDTLIAQLEDWFVDAIQNNSENVL